MKVFDWVNRRFVHGNTGITSFQGDKKRVERNGKSKVNIEMHGLLDHDTALDVFEGWKEGILCIGTFAIGPLETTITTTSKFELINKQVDDNDDELDDKPELIPLMKMELFSHELEKNEANGGVNQCKVMTKQVEDESKTENINNEKECQMKRVTLADLFLEDSKKLRNSKEDCLVKGKSKIKPISQTKNGLSKAKKLLKEELHPVKKLNQLMKRMTKKKIHPEMAEGGKTTEKNPIKEGRGYTCPFPTHEPDLDATYDSASLLRLQGCGN